MHAKSKFLRPVTNRVYVTVMSATDPTGYVQPRAITWSDGRTFPIEAVRDFRPADTVGLDLQGDCYTVIIQGQEKHLFFEHTSPTVSHSRPGRWFVEVQTIG
ncbi:MAG: hypothetical protein LUI07_00910 [Lachnospiraceae bacterium]|nr:hypothetical protein [Lachnospiraceae bacterium]